MYRCFQWTDIHLQNHCPSRRLFADQTDKRADFCVGSLSNHLDEGTLVADSATDAAGSRMSGNCRPEADPLYNAVYFDLSDDVCGVCHFPYPPGCQTPPVFHSL